MCIRDRYKLEQNSEIAEEERSAYIGIYRLIARVEPVSYTHLDVYKRQNYHMAEELADSINWKRVRNANSLIKAGEVYETAERYDDAKEMFLLAYERSPIGRTIVYRLAELAIHVGNYDEAMEYYEEFVEMAPNDSLKFVLKYKIYKAKGESLSLIHI